MVSATPEEIGALFEGLEHLSYYDYLGLKLGHDYLAVREAFYARAQVYHPDRFVHVQDETEKRRVYAVYKRMTEAYHVLMEPQLRFAYDQALAAGEVRLSDVARSRRRTAEERVVANAFARIYVRSARAKLDRGDRVGAWIDTRLGLSLEDSPALRSLLAELDVMSPTLAGREEEGGAR